MDDLNGRFEIENINGRLEMDDSVWPLQLGGLDIMDRVRFKRIALISILT